VLAGLRLNGYAIKAPQKAADAPMPGQAGLPLGDAPGAPV